MSPLFATLLLLISMMVTTPVRTALATRAPRGGCARSRRCVYTPIVRRTGLLSWLTRGYPEAHRRASDDAPRLLRGLIDGPPRCPEATPRPRR